MLGRGEAASKKLLAAFAVLAVAFVVLAAIPAVDAADSDATGANVAKIGDTEYATLKEAMDASNTISDDDVTMEIIGVAEWVDGWAYNSKNYDPITT